jgi:AMP-polyphosphate phosphotransferase
MPVRVDNSKGGAMLENIDLDRSLSKADYKEQLPLLQANLYDLGHEAFTTKTSVMIVFEGWLTAGKGSTIGALTERLDPRGFRVIPVMPPRTSETRYPWMWRFWLKIPARGQIVAFDGSWYRRVLTERVNKTVKRKEWKQAYDDIAEFEKQMADDGTVVIKFWFHISKREQSKRLKKLLKQELAEFQILDEDTRQNKNYDKYLEAAEDMLARTHTPYAPWTIIEATDKYYARMKVFETIIRAMEVKLGAKAEALKQEATHA